MNSPPEDRKVSFPLGQVVIAQSSGIVMRESTSLTEWRYTRPANAALCCFGNRLRKV